MEKSNQPILFWAYGDIKQLKVFVRKIWSSFKMQINKNVLIFVASRRPIGWSQRNITMSNERNVSTHD